MLLHFFNINLNNKVINKIINFSVNNKLITGFLLAIFVLFGIYSFTQLNVDALPDVTNNQVQVVTNTPNLATQEVEKFITYPLETEFKSLSEMVELRSTSRSGLSVITIVFKDNLPINTARQWVDEKIKIATNNILKQYESHELLPPTTVLGEIIHAEINETTETLLPGMYVEARVKINNFNTTTLPTEAIVNNGNEHFIFVSTGKNTFQQIKVNIGAIDLGFTEVKAIDEMPNNVKVVIEGAYYLLSELTKGSGKK